MANEINTNTAYIDTGSSAITTDPTKLTGITVTPSGGAATIVLQDNQSTKVNVINLTVPSGNPSRFFDLSKTPIMFTNGIFIGTLTTALATLIYERV